MTDIQLLLQQLASIRDAIPGIERVSARNSTPEGRSMVAEDLEIEEARSFDLLSLSEALQSFADELIALATRDTVLRQYFSLQKDLARDPLNIRIRIGLELMRVAYEKDFGEPIPPRPPAEE